MSTLRTALTRRLLLAIVAMLSAAGAAVFLLARSYLTDQFDAALLAKAQALSALVEQEGGEIEMEFSDGMLDGFAAPNGPHFYQVWQADGATFRRSRSLGTHDLPQRRGTQAAPLLWNLPLPDGQPGRAAGIRFNPHFPDNLPPDSTATEVVLVLAGARSDLDRTLRTLLLLLIGCGAALLAVTALVVPRVLRRGLTPLQDLADEAARIDAGSLTARFPDRNLPGELVPITARLNELLARLEVSFDRERRFSADVAHELRTPVAELRSMAELAVKLPDARASNADEETLSIALHLESILTRLLALTRAGQGAQPVESESVSLAKLAEEVCAAHRADAAARSLTFHCRTETAVEFASDPVLLRSIVNNLVENAVTYTPPGGTVEVTTGPAPVLICVSNTVSGLTNGDLPHLFERFWRKDAARAGDGHAGLGLALARAFAHSLGCGLTAAFEEDGRLTLTLRASIRKRENNRPLEQQATPIIEKAVDALPVPAYLPPTHFHLKPPQSHGQDPCIHQSRHRRADRRVSCRFPVRGPAESLRR